MVDRANRVEDFDIIRDEIESLCAGIIDTARIYCDSDEGFQLIDNSAQMIFERLEQIWHIVHDLEEGEA